MHRGTTRGRWPISITTLTWPGVCVGLILGVLAPWLTVMAADEEGFVVPPDGVMRAAGREVPKRRGVRFGRPKKLNVEQRDLAVRLRAEGKSVKEVANIFGVHVSTIYRLSDRSIV